jgi:hypothetical protein
MAITINWPTGVITVPKADMTLIQSIPIEIRELNLNTFRLTLKDLEDDAEGQPWPTTHNHNTAVTVGGVTLARVVEIINGYTVTFEDGSYAVNLVGANSNLADVVNLNSVSVRSANSAGLVNLQGLDAIRFQVESLRDTHQGFGSVYYYDPINGNDGNPGNEPSAPVRTFAAALSLCSSGRGDVIYILAPGEAQASINERWVINKASVYVRGPGRGVILKPVGAGGGAPTISIEADEVSLSGFIVEASTADATSANAIDVWGKFSRIERMWVNRAKNGIRYCAGDYHKIRGCEIEQHAENGILVEDIRFGTAFAGNGAPREIDIDDIPNNYLNGQNGIKLVADTVNYSAGESTRLIRVYSSNIELNTLYGIDIGTGVYRTMVGNDVMVHLNTSGNVLDNGTQTTDFSNVAASVWDVPVASHLTAGTTGKALSDAGSAGNPWGSLVAGNTDAGTFGELVGRKLLTVGKFLGLK